MNTKVIGFPSNPSVDDEYQGWTWDGDKWVSDAVKGGLWEQNGDDIYYDAGNVSVSGTLSVDNQLFVSVDNGTIAKFENTGTGGAYIGFADSSTSSWWHQGVGTSGDDLKFKTSNQNRLTIDNAGNATFSGSVLIAGGSPQALSPDPHIYRNGGNLYISGRSDGGSGGNLHFQTGASSDIAMSLNSAGNATFSGTVDAAGFTINGVPISGGGGGLPDGGYTYGWNITATDFIATSDERLKTRIAPMPVGLIDDIKPVSWDWIDGGGKSAGVVAQQLQEIGLGDYVHENEDGQLGVNYQALTAILLAEVIALKKAIK